MADRYLTCARRSLASEGLFSNHPADNGGATMQGITQKTLAAWRGRAVTVEELRAITEAEALAIYRAWYWDAVSADGLPVGIDGLVFDHAITSGGKRAAKMLQSCLDVAVDGDVGPVTIAAARAADPLGLAQEFTALRRAYLASLDDAEHFGRGWDKRAVERLAEAKRDIASAALGLSEDAAELVGRGNPVGIVGALLAAALAGLFGIDLAGLFQ